MLSHNPAPLYALLPLLAVFATVMPAAAQIVLTALGLHAALHQVLHQLAK